MKRMDDPLENLNQSILDCGTRSPDSGQRYFLDKMRLLKLKLKKYEEENRVLYSCLAEQKVNVRDSLREKCAIINSFQYELSELKKQILVLMNVLAASASTAGQSVEDNDARQQLLSDALNTVEEQQALVSEYDKAVMVHQNRTLEENFKKELKKVQDLEHHILELNENMSAEREELMEKNIFLEEENQIQREQIVLLEEALRDLECAEDNRASKEQEIQTDLTGLVMERLVADFMEEVRGLEGKVEELQLENGDLVKENRNTRRELMRLHRDYHEQGKALGGLENELNALKLVHNEHVPDIYDTPPSSSSSSSPDCLNRCQALELGVDVDGDCDSMAKAIQLQKTRLQLTINNNRKERRQRSFDSFRNL